MSHLPFEILQISASIPKYLWFEFAHLWSLLQDTFEIFVFSSSEILNNSILQPDKPCKMLQLSHGLTNRPTASHKLGKRPSHGWVLIPVEFHHEGPRINDSNCSKYDVILYCNIFKFYFNQVGLT